MGDDMPFADVNGQHLYFEDSGVRAHR